MTVDGCGQQQHLDFEQNTDDLSPLISESHQLELMENVCESGRVLFLTFDPLESLTALEFGSTLLARSTG